MKNLTILFIILFFAIVSPIRTIAQSVSSENNMDQMNQLKEVISSYTKSEVSNSILIQFFATSIENLSRFKDIKKTMGDHPEYDADFLDQIITAMEEKLLPGEVVSEKEGG